MFLSLLASFSLIGLEIAPPRAKRKAEAAKKRSLVAIGEVRSRQSRLAARHQTANHLSRQSLF